MATYKVLQDIEAEDKFLGPLTLKQCIFGAVSGISIYLSIVFVTKGIWVMSLPLLPLALVTGFLAFPWGRDQPTEVWLLAKIRFYFKPRKRIWDQTGIQELVRVTAPPKVDLYTSDNLSQNEVKSRLKALADTIDSRGWAVKNASINEAVAAPISDSDRLIGASTLPQVALPFQDEVVNGDMLDESHMSSIGSQLQESTRNNLGRAVEKMRPAARAADDNFWFMNQPASGPGMATFSASTVVNNTSTPALPSDFRSPTATAADEAAALQEIHKKAAPNQSFRNHKTVNPGGQPATFGSGSSVTAAPDPATIDLARNNDRPIDSLAREANMLRPASDDGEVSVSLH